MRSTGQLCKKYFKFTRTLAGYIVMSISVYFSRDSDSNARKRKHVDTPRPARSQYDAPVTASDDCVWFDVETAESFSDLGLVADDSWSSVDKSALFALGTGKMNVTTVCLAANDDPRIHVYLREENQAQVASDYFAKLGLSDSRVVHVDTHYKKLCQRLIAAKEIVAYNAKFDIGCMLKYMPKSATNNVHYKALWAKTYDPMLCIANFTKDKFISLNEAAKLAGLDVEKGGDGLKAISDFWNGRYGELAAYCATDVELLRKVDNALKNGTVYPVSKTPILRVLVGETATKFTKTVSTQCGSGKVEQQKRCQR